jgi:hypothetical protein
MQKAPILSEEENRLCALHELKLLDTEAEERFSSSERIGAFCI